MRFLSLLFPYKCPYCRQITGGRSFECDKCRSELVPFRHDIVLRSGCRCIVPFGYKGRVRKAILDYKFYSLKFNVESLSRQLAAVLSDMAGDIDIVCNVPISKARRRKRGFDQSELLAKKTARLLGIEHGCLLKKIKNNKPQHELDGEKRVSNVRGVYAAAKPGLITGRRILLIDDICTTGYTLSECCRVLLSAGAASVVCAAAAGPPGVEKEKQNSNIS